MKLFLRFHCLLTHLDQIMGLHWATMVLFLIDFNIVLFILLGVTFGYTDRLMLDSDEGIRFVCTENELRGLHLELIMDTCLGLMKELIWVLLMTDLMVLIK